MNKLRLFFFFCLLLGIGCSSPKTPSPESSVQQVQQNSHLKNTDILYRTEPTASGQPAKYYIIESKKKGNLIEVLSRREGSSGITWIKVQIDCKNKRMRTIAEGYDDFSTFEELPKNQQKWYELYDGSSKSDLFNYICK